MGRRTGLSGDAQVTTKTTADRIRDLAAKGLEPAAIAAKLGCSRQAVHAAIKRAQKRGRPRTHYVTCPDCGRVF